MPAPVVSTEEDPRGLFGPIYTFDEWQLAYDEEEQRKQDEKDARTSKILGTAGQRPSHWPDDVDPDTGKWAFWLPEGWGQGIKPTAGGKTLKCFVGPPGSDKVTGLGKRIFHKPEVEKFVGYKFKSKEEYEAEAGEEAKEKNVRNAHDALPFWPGQKKKDEPDWLPHDWCIAYRQLPTSLHRIYLPPGQREGYLWHRNCVEQWLGGHQKQLASIENSRKMEDIMVAGRPERALDLPKAKMKRRRLETGGEHRVATDASYAACPRLAGCRYGALDDSGCPAEARADLTRQEESSRELLGQRGFTDIDFMAFFLRALDEKEDDGDLGARPYSNVVEQLLGLFYRMTELNGRPCYHQIRTSGGGSACTGLYLFWSPSRAAWKLSSKLDDNAAGYAVFPCDEADQTTNLVSSEGRGWTVLTQGFFTQPAQPAQPAEPGQPGQPATLGDV